MRFRPDRLSRAGAASSLFTLLPGLALCGSFALQAQVSPVGGQFQINSYTPGNQRAAALAVDDAGDFVVVWQSSGSAGTDDSYFSIQMQRYDATGAVAGGELQVNTDTLGSQIGPDVAMAAAGAFVVVWSDANSLNVQGQLFDAGGAPSGPQFQVNTYTPSSQIDPAVASDAAGNFVVVWQSDGSSGTDTSYSSIQGQRYDSAGLPAGGEFQVNTYTPFSQLSAAVASDAAGNFVVVWAGGGSDSTDGSGYSIHGRRFLANGTPASGEFQVNTYTTGEQEYPAVDIDDAGRFVVAWRSAGSSGTDTLATSIQARRYDAAGNPADADFQVNTYTTNGQSEVAVATAPGGEFLIAWMSEGSSFGDTSSSSVQTQRYRGDGSPIAGQFQVNSYTTSFQLAPTLATDSRGNFVVAWDSSVSGGIDNSGFSIQGQLYDGVFRDGFESAGTGRWSAAVP
jgi:hypothetical protein